MRSLLTVLAAGTLLLAAPSLAGETFDAVKRQGTVRCGVLKQGGTTISDVDTNGRWQGFFPDICRAVAIAALGDPERVEFVQVPGRLRMQALKSREIDILVQNATQTLGREAVDKVVFPAIYLYDGQGFMARGSLKARNLAELAALPEAKVCVLSNTTTLSKLQEMAATTHKGVKPIVVDTVDGYFTAFISGQCDVFTHDRLFLTAHSTRKDLGSVTIFPDIVSKEPLGPIVRDDDREWERLVRWTVLALVQAEELGITAKTAAQRRSEDQNADVQRLLGGKPGLGEMLGVAEDWAFRMIATLGNYGEIYDRHLGAASDVKLDRGLNRLWTQGGLLYAPPMR